ncbi:MAG: hypothetical protein AAF141_09010 [Pseudomonadota bacterium]
MSDQNQPVVAGSDGAVAAPAAKTVAQEMSSAARALRFQSMSRRALHKIVGLRPRRRDVIFRWLLALAVAIFIVIPVVGTSVYYGLIASDRFESETRFVVRSATAVLSRNPTDDGVGLSTAKIVQDTQITTNYLNSPGLITNLEAIEPLETFYSRRDIDWLSRLKDGATAEEKLEFWATRITNTIKLPGGIVIVKLQAHTPEEAQTLLKRVIALSEDQLNALNEGIWSGTLGGAEKELAEAQNALKSVRRQISQAQLVSGVFDVEQQSEALTDLIIEVRGELLKIEGELQTKSGQLDPNSRVLRNLRLQADAQRNQLERLERELAGDGERALSDSSSIFAQLKLEQEIAEQRFEDAVRELERLRLLSSTQLLYLDPVLQPTLPEEATQPERIKRVAFFSFIGIFCWLFALLALLSARKKFD